MTSGFSPNAMQEFIDVVIKPKFPRVKGVMVTQEPYNEFIVVRFSDEAGTEHHIRIDMMTLYSFDERLVWYNFEKLIIEELDKGHLKKFRGGFYVRFM